MCQFFSVTSNGGGQIKYFDWTLRKKILYGNLKGYNPDSHTSINDYFGFRGIREDRRNKYEFNPFTGEFIVDQINGRNDRASVERKVRAIDFKTIIPQLNLHPIVHPFEIKPTISVDIAIQLLKRWDSVRASIGASVWESVGASVWESVGASVWDSVGASVRDSVRDSVGASVWDSVGESVWAYASSFFTIDNWKYIEHEKGANPYQCMIDLWNAGYVPSYDGSKWRLYTKDGVVWEGEAFYKEVEE